MDAVGGKKVLKMLDYIQGLNGLPKSNVLKFFRKAKGGKVIFQPQIKQEVLPKNVQQC